MTLRMPHFLGAIVLLAVGGVVHGKWTHRWSETTLAQGGEDLLSKVTEPVGDWKPGAFFHINANDVPKKTQTMSRQFAHQRTNRTLVVSLTSGVPGIVAAHTPDVCYLGSGYKLKSAVTKENIPLPDGRSVAFYVADFQKTTATVSETVRVRWAWSADGQWEAPDYPRLFFARRQLQLPVLYKLYVVNVVDETDLTKTDPYRTFAAELASRLGNEMAGGPRN
ncbi:hypothetical protein [Zavarzinella formosa]|uniref:hypothetical protein n=1 Tax=Zavarzinella formosa TaxID=360055 RepID=UPI0002E82D65|nr:hypothetical protein [Zavarzinella formosa]